MYTDFFLRFVLWGFNKIHSLYIVKFVINKEKLN